MSRKRDIPPLHPGKLLLEEFMHPMGLTQYRLAKGTGLPSIHISSIVRGRRSITAETALRLGRFFGMSAEFWINAQAHYDLQVAESKIADTVRREVTPFAEMAIATQA
ncbi:MAG: addiction module antidote protein, HigA family [Alphaproteobacteria bacterium]|nr:addiction module antidote protein, HigA family [Alphaproteobacteria bacterium]